jgi:hypothetical protein
MNTFTKKTLALLSAALMCAGVAGPAMAGTTRADVVREADIQAQIDQKIDAQAGDRQVIQDLLRRPDVRRIAANAGIDITRANAAVGTLSGPELRTIAARAEVISADTGGVETVTLTVTTIIIILLLIIILAD